MSATRGTSLHVHGLRHRDRSGRHSLGQMGVPQPRWRLPPLGPGEPAARRRPHAGHVGGGHGLPLRSAEHTSELQSLMRISYAVFCLKKKTHNNRTILITHNITTIAQELV